MRAQDDAESSALEKRLLAIVEPVVRSEALVLVELQWRSEGRGHVLRIYLDRREGGVTLEECAEVSRQVSHLLDVEDVIPGSFHLEVSSPGLTRRIKRPQEFELFAGRPARLVVQEEGGKTATIKGILKGLKADEVLIETQGRVRAVPLARVAKANLAPAGQGRAFSGAVK